MITEEVLQKVKARYDLVRVVAKYTGPLVLAGDKFQCRCPFHGCGSPAFTVCPRYQIFYCFGCEYGGEVFRFMKRLRGTSFLETVRDLGREAGIQVP